MKRVVFFSDVHGNITGLQAIITEIEKIENVTHIVGLGDYFGYSAGHNDIIDLCMDKNVTLIRGGHEEILKEIDNGKDGGKYFPEIYMTHEWLVNNLKKEYYDYVINLPLEFRLTLNAQYSIIAFHAALNDMESFTCGSDRPLQILEEAYGKLDENIIIYGHYHEPHVLPLHNKLLVNCAAVGMRKANALSNFTVIEYDEEKIAIIQRQVPYDKNEEENLVIQRGIIRRL